MARFLYPAAVLGAAVILSCGQADAPPEISASVYSLMGPGVPDDVDCLAISVTSGGAQRNSRNFTVAGLMDRDANGRTENIIGGDGLLPAYGTPFEVRILAQSTLGGLCQDAIPGTRSYSGSSGTIRLRAGERRVLSIALYEVGAAELLQNGTELPSRFLHTSTPLGDGRVLISGGFDTLTASACPGDILADSCYVATATNEAFIFDTPSGRFLPVAGGMLEARGGHTATPMNDGRILIAGGATRALIAMSEGEQPVFSILPLDGGFLRAHASFEFFTRGLESPSDDPLRAGLPGRGLFEGPAGNPSAPGTLNHERFLHAAATTDEQRVVLAGGTGGGATSTTFEVFDLLRPGGEGVNQEDGVLQVARRMPSAFVLNDTVWIYGGGVATSNMDLAEVWNAGTPVGQTSPATDSVLDLTAERPELALFRPQIVPNVAGDKALVTGWFGPRCDAFAVMSTQPTFEGDDVFQCTEPIGAVREGTPARNFFLSDSISAFQPFSNENQAFASAVRLGSPESVLVLGGLKRDLETRTDAIAYRFDTESLLGDSCLLSPRALHASTVLPDNRILTTGGIFKVPASGALFLTRAGAEIMTLNGDGSLPSSAGCR